MHLSHAKTTLALLGLAAWSLACGPDPVDPPGLSPPRTITSNEALTTANQNARHALVGAAQAGRSATDAGLLGKLFSGDAVAPCPLDQNCEPEPQTSLEDQAKAAADRLAAQILNAGNIELEEPTRIVLRLVPEVACATSSTLAAAIDPSCRSMYESTPVRLELSSRREGDVDLKLSIGTQAVATLSLYANEMAVELDLGAAVEAYNQLLAASGEGEAVAGTFQGRVKAAVTVEGNEQASFALSILSGLVIDTTVDNEHYRAELGAATPAFELTLVGSDPTVAIRTNNGAGKLVLPLSLLAGSDPTTCQVGPNGETVCDPPAPAPSGSLELQIPSSRGALILGANDAVTLDFTLGDAIRAFHDGHRIFQADLNPSSGRAVHLEVAPSDELVQLSSAGSLTAVADFDLASLASDFDLPSWLIDETLTVELSGNAPVVQLGTGGSTSTPGGEPAPAPALIKMIAGQLRLASRAANLQVSVAAGQCLYSDTAPEGSTHPLDGLSATACR